MFRADHTMRHPLLAACSDEAPVNPGSAQQAPQAPAVQPAQAPAAQTQEAAPTASAADSSLIGIAECDEFLKKYEACLSKMDAKNRESYMENLVSFREQYQELAKNDAVKAALPEQCRSSQESLSASLIADFGCEF